MTFTKVTLVWEWYFIFVQLIHDLWTLSKTFDKEHKTDTRRFLGNISASSFLNKGKTYINGEHLEGSTNLKINELMLSNSGADYLTHHFCFCNRFKVQAKYCPRLLKMLNVKLSLTSIGIPIINIKQSWDHLHNRTLYIRSFVPEIPSSQ